MALPINIDDVLNGRSVEWERLEFKGGWNPEAILHTICAFANDFHNLGGGYIFIGITEHQGRPVLPPAGLAPDTLDAIQQELLELGHRLQPFYHPIIQPYLIDDRHVLVLWVPGGQSRPYKAPLSLSKDNREYRYYIRKGSCTVAAKHDDEVELLSLAAQIPFDDRINQRATITDLKSALVLSHLRDIGSKLAEEVDRLDFERICRRMSLVDGPAEYVMPRNVGLMFFHERPDQFFPQAQIDIVQFPEGPDGDMLIENTFRGPLAQQLRDALLFLSNTILREYVVKRPDRAEADRFFNYPYAAVEESLVNAVYHRSYEIREPIEVRVLPDHITITSHPGPDRSISMEDMRQGRLVARRYRNRRIGEFLKELRLTEGRGTGVPTIRAAMQSNGSLPPSFQTDEDRSYFVTTLPIHKGATPHVTPHVTPQVKEDRARALLVYCNSPRDRASIQAFLKLKDIKHLRQRYLSRLLSQGLLELTDPEHPTSRAQKYRTTVKGQQILKEGVREGYSLPFEEQSADGVLLLEDME